MSHQEPSQDEECRPDQDTLALADLKTGEPGAAGRTHAGDNRSNGRQRAWGTSDVQRGFGFATGG